MACQWRGAAMSPQSILFTDASSDAFIACMCMHAMKLISSNIQGIDWAVMGDHFLGLVDL